MLSETRQFIGLSVCARGDSGDRTRTSPTPRCPQPWLRHCQPGRLEPRVPPSAHAVLREARVLRALEGSDVPVPRVLFTCDDESVLGVPFYVMEYLEGDVVTDMLPAGLASAENAHRMGSSAQERLGDSKNR